MNDMPGKCELIHTEEGIVYRVQGQASVGIHHLGADDATMGVLMVVGGRQYRVGAHRQFVLLARTLAKSGIPVFRFDIRGMGDSDGRPQHFLANSEDIKIAVATFKKHSPDLKSVVIWGLCDGATAGVMSLGSLDDVSGVMMVNPWVTTHTGAAKVQIKHYYRQRVFNSSFWKKLLSGKLDLVASLRSLSETVRLASCSMLGKSDHSAELPELVFNAIEQFNGQVRIIISNSDFTALEFYEKYNNRFGKSVIAPSRLEMIRTDSDHTFSGEGQHDRLVEITLEFVLLCRDDNHRHSSTSAGGG